MKKIRVRTICVLCIVFCTAQLIAQENVNEQRIVYTWYFNNGIDAKGSLTFAQYKDNPDLVGIFADRPGDKVALNMDGGGGVIIWSGIGSEVRTDGNMQLFGKNLIVAAGSRLCFKRAEDGWVYVCGLGQAEDIETKEIIKLGHNRTIESCLSLLSSPDPIQREGTARDLGRLAKGKEMPHVVTQLSVLLNDPISSVRCGAAEGLGLIGQDECVVSLKKAASKETDEITKEFIAEALALCGGRVTIGDVTAPEIPLIEAANLYSTGKTGWVNDKLKNRFKAGAPQTVKSLKKHLRSNDMAIRLAAAQLSGSVKCIETEDVLKSLSETDPNAKVREAAKEALKSMQKN